MISAAAAHITITRNYRPQLSHANLSKPQVAATESTNTTRTRTCVHSTQSSCACIHTQTTTTILVLVRSPPRAMADSSLGFQNIFTFGRKEESDVSTVTNLSVVEIWLPYDRTLRMAAESDSALIEVEVSDHIHPRSACKLEFVCFTF